MNKLVVLDEVNHQPKVKWR